MSKAEFNVAVVGATGAVGNEMISVLEGRGFPVRDIRLLASKNSIGKKLSFRGKEVPVFELTADSFAGIDIALFSAGAARSLQFAPAAVRAGAVVVDNSSAFRMDPEVPLVVPEVNRHDIFTHKGIIANPNCSTIQMVVCLKPIHDAVGVKRVVVSTYQSVSGTGKRAIEELALQTRALLNMQEAVCNVYPHRIAFNCLPHIDSFTDSGYTKEEVKMMNETKKIMGDPAIAVTATTVRVPVFYSHSESVNVETHRKLSVERCRELLAGAPGVIVVDEPAKSGYPLASVAAGRDEVFVGRIREDRSIQNGLDMWIVSDNIRKGAALNAVQIAEIVAEEML
ncbi:MAG: aspartate-semialdehyde dehydrogenase [Candidatus Tectomicrobia bacterium]|nr:aspartate-semialdehyde dehydrogenase [Candidatus Tectomicrobia bacterium]